MRSPVDGIGFRISGSRDAPPLPEGSSADAAPAVRLANAPVPRLARSPAQSTSRREIVERLRASMGTPYSLATTTEGREPGLYGGKRENTSGSGAHLGPQPAGRPACCRATATRPRASASYTTGTWTQSMKLLKIFIFPAYFFASMLLANS